MFDTYVHLVMGCWYGWLYDRPIGGLLTLTNHCPSHTYPAVVLKKAPGWRRQSGVDPVGGSVCVSVWHYVFLSLAGNRSRELPCPPRLESGGSLVDTGRGVLMRAAGGGTHTGLRAPWMFCLHCGCFWCSFYTSISLGLYVPGNEARVCFYIDSK